MPCPYGQLVHMCLLPQASELHLLVDDPLLIPCLALSFCLPVFADTYCRIGIHGLLSCTLHRCGDWSQWV